MKKLLLFAVIALVASFSTQAQYFELSKDGHVYGSEIEVVGSPLDSEIYFDPLVTNISDIGMSVKVRRTVITAVEGTDNYFCWVACYAPFIDESTESFYMAPGFTTEPDYFSVHYTPLEHPGSTTVDYTFFNKDDESQSQTFRVIFKASPDAIDENILRGVSFSDVFPNPANDLITINYQLVPEVKTAQVRISNLLGSVVGEYTFDQGSTSMKMDVSQMEGGIYFYSIVLNGEVLHTKKLIVR